MKNVILVWNDIFLQTIRIAGGPPGPIARNGAMMHIAMYEAINSILPTPQRREAYLSGIVDPANNSDRNSAMIMAAYTVLKHNYQHSVYSAQFGGFTIANANKISTFLDEKKVETLAQFASPTPALNVKGETHGIHVATVMIANRAADGANVPMPYDSATTIVGKWRNSGSGNAATPNWGKVKTFSGAASDAFRPTLPGGLGSLDDLLSSDIYAAQLNEVKSLGAHDSTTRTPEQTEIAIFWANDLDGTSKPPGQLYDLTQVVALQKGLGDAMGGDKLVECARLFALVAVSMGDAAVVAWDAKYDTVTSLWRPESAIRNAYQHQNPRIQGDGNWKPLSALPNGTRFSPPFPAYVSGHATFGAAHAAIMRLFFGTDNVTFELSTEDPHAIRENGVKKTRTFNSFTEAALENARSRVYLGVHFQFDGDNGFLSGKSSSEYIFANLWKKTGVEARKVTVQAKEVVG
jgi:hypothetical protein